MPFKSVYERTDPPVQQKQLDPVLAAEAEKLRVSGVDLTKEDESIAIMQDDNNEESDADFYTPYDLSPEKIPRANDSDAKFFNQLQSQRQEVRRSFSPPFKAKRKADEVENGEDDAKENAAAH